MVNSVFIEFRSFQCILQYGIWLGEWPKYVNNKYQLKLFNPFSVADNIFIIERERERETCTTLHIESQFIYFCRCFFACVFVCVCGVNICSARPALSHRIANAAKSLIPVWIHFECSRKLNSFRPRIDSNKWTIAMAARKKTPFAVSSFSSKLLNANTRAHRNRHMHDNFSICLHCLRTTNNNE